MNRTEASVTGTSLAGGTRAVRAQEAPGADDGRFGFEPTSQRVRLGKLEEILRTPFEGSRERS